MANLTHLYVSSRMTDSVRDFGDRLSHKVHILGKFSSSSPHTRLAGRYPADYSRKNPTEQMYCLTAAGRLLGTDKEQNYVVAAGNMNTLASNVSIYVCLLGTANCFMVQRRVDGDISFKVHQHSTTTISRHRPFTTGSFFDTRVRSMSSSKVEQRRGIGHATTAAVLDITSEASCLRSHRRPPHSRQKVFLVVSWVAPEPHGSGLLLKTGLKGKSNRGRPDTGRLPACVRVTRFGDPGTILSPCVSSWIGTGERLFLLYGWATYFISSRALFPSIFSGLSHGRYVTSAVVLDPTRARAAASSHTPVPACVHWTSHHPSQ